MNPESNKLGQSAENDTPFYLGHRINTAGTHRGQTPHQGIVMESIAGSPETFLGRTPSSRSNVDHETTLYPLDFNHAFFQAHMDQTLTNAHGNHLGGEQLSHMGVITGNHAFDYPAFIPQPEGYPYVESPLRRMQSLSTGDLFGLRSQGTYDGYQPRGSTTAVSNPYSQGLQPESHDTPTRSIHVETTPESSTAPENIMTGTSSSPVLPSSSGSQGPCISVWYPAGRVPPVGRNRKRRKMNEDELVRNRALKAAGGACENCRRRKKKCHHKDNRLILSAPASTPTTTSTSAPTPTPTQARANTAPAPAPRHHVSPTYRRNLGPRSVVRPRPNDTRQEATFGQQQQHNPSIASSYGPSLGPSMFSSSDGGALSNGTMTSAQSDATTLAADEYHPEMGAEASFGMNTAGFGHQFNGQLAPEFDPTNPDNQIGLLETWYNSALEHTSDAGH